MNSFVQYFNSQTVVKNSFYSAGHFLSGANPDEVWSPKVNLWELAKQKNFIRQMMTTIRSVKAL